MAAAAAPADALAPPCRACKTFVSGLTWKYPDLTPELEITSVDHAFVIDAVDPVGVRVRVCPYKLEPNYGSDIRKFTVRGAYQRFDGTFAGFYACRYVADDVKSWPCVKQNCGHPVDHFRITVSRNQTSPEWVWTARVVNANDPELVSAPFLYEFTREPVDLYVGALECFFSRCAMASGVVACLLRSRVMLSSVARPLALLPRLYGVETPTVALAPGRPYSARITWTHLRVHRACKDHNGICVVRVTVDDNSFLIGAFQPIKRHDAGADPKPSTRAAAAVATIDLTGDDDDDDDDAKAAPRGSPEQRTKALLEVTGLEWRARFKRQTGTKVRRFETLMGVVADAVRAHAEAEPSSGSSSDSSEYFPLWHDFTERRDG